MKRILEFLQNIIEWERITIENQAKTILYN